MFSPSDPLSDPPQSRLEHYLIESGLLNHRQLTLAKKIQNQEQGPLAMILLRLSFITVDQLAPLMQNGFAVGL